MIKNILILAAILMLFLVSTSSAQIATADSTLAPAANDYSPSLAGIIFKLILSMFLIVALIYFSMYLIKKVNSRAAGGGLVGDTVKVIGRTFISPKQSLYLVKIGRRYTILGATESNINMITELSDQESRDFDSRESKPVSVSPGSRFADILKGISKK